MLSALALAASLVPGSAAAEEVRFAATLRGDAAPTDTGSKATGQATIVVDTERQTIDMTLDVTGLKVSDLWGQLIKAPAGPIHLHLYAAQDHAHVHDAELVMPTPFGETYADTATGFRVQTRGFTYADAQRILQTQTTFEQFVQSMRSGAVRLNIHTNAQPQGEISGAVRPVA